MLLVIVAGSVSLLSYGFLIDLCELAITDLCWWPIASFLPNQYGFNFCFGMEMQEPTCGASLMVFRLFQHRILLPYALIFIAHRC